MFPPKGLFNALTVGASNGTSIQETRFAGFVRNCANFAESAARAKPGKKAEVFLGARLMPPTVSGDRLGPKAGIRRRFV